MPKEAHNLIDDEIALSSDSECEIMVSITQSDENNNKMQVNLLNDH